MIEELFVATGEAEKIHYKTEQAFYSIDFLKGVVEAFCKDDGGAVFAKFLEMLVFDALIGSMDRHAQNWGVLQRTELPERYRLAPIFDSARALLWLLPESTIRIYDKDDVRLIKHIAQSKPCIGPPRDHPKINKCNHFDVVIRLCELYPHLLYVPLRRVATDAVLDAAKMLDEFPYSRYLSAARRRLILKVLRIRADKLMDIAQAL